ncbi:helix-turn-helix domain-containing protein [Rhodoblastus sp.]|uniref:helix-turn-helix domain-containing protein n=1 Tax=Rhodoblastus sp. TaxID=1962975 RepID=UPI003F9495BF
MKNNLAHDVTLRNGSGDQASFTPFRRQSDEGFEQTGWTQSRAARQLDISLRQLRYAPKKRGIAVRKF